MAESKLGLIQKENLWEIIHNLPVTLDKSCKGYKEMLQQMRWKKWKTTWRLYMMVQYCSIF